MTLVEMVGVFIKNPDARMSIFCAVLLAALLGWIPSPMTEQQANNLRMLKLLEQQGDAMRAHDQNGSEERREQTAQARYANMLLRSLCRGIVPAQNQHQCEPKYYGWEEK